MKIEVGNRTVHWGKFQFYLFFAFFRYTFFFERYLKALPEGSADAENTRGAITEINKAALHCNAADAKYQNFSKLLQIQQYLGGQQDLVSPTREFVKEGKIKKISSRNQEHQERYLFLVS